MLPIDGSSSVPTATATAGASSTSRSPFLKWTSEADLVHVSGEADFYTIANGRVRAQTIHHTVLSV